MKFFANIRAEIVDLYRLSSYTPVMEMRNSKMTQATKTPKTPEIVRSHQETREALLFEALEVWREEGRKPSNRVEQLEDNIQFDLDHRWYHWPAPVQFP
jgi:hypothetical protein